MKRVIARVFEPIILRAVELKVQEKQGTEEKKFIKYRDIKVHYSLTLCILCTFTGKHVLCQAVKTKMKCRP